MDGIKQVPILRFSDFSHEWKSTKIEQTSKIYSGGTPNRNTESFWNGDIPWVTTSLIDFNKISESYEYITDSGLQNSSAKLFSKGSILIAMYGQGKTRGKSAVLGIDAATNQACLALIVKRGFDNIFLFQYLCSRYDHLRRLSNDGGQKNLSSGLIKKVKIKIPSYEEQQKIAAFLTAVDTKITQLEQKQALLQQYKQGMMQQLFSQQIRFKDYKGNNYPEWKTVKLDDIATFSKGKGITKSDVVKNGLNKCVRYGELYTVYNEKIEYIHSSTNLATNGFVLSEFNDVVIPASGETAFDIATASCITVDGVILGGDINIIKSDIDGVFLAYLLNSKYKKTLARFAQGISVIHLYANQLRLLKMSVPSKPEQQKIANFLSVFDKKIDLVAEQIEQAKSFKKGLLQQMFV